MNEQNPQTEEQPCLTKIEERPLPIHTRNAAKARVFNPAIPINNREFESIDYSSNLDFTKFPREERMARSLATIKPDLHNITPQKINIELIDPKRKPKSNFPRKSPEKLKPKKEHKENKSPEEDTQTIPTTELGDVPLYEVWPGNNRFFFNGNIAVGPKSDRITNTIAWLLILGISLLYFITAFPFLCKSKIYTIPFISIYLFVSTIVFLLFTSLTNPGIIPRRAVWELIGEVPYPYNGGSNKKDNMEASRSLNKTVTLEIGTDKSTSKEVNLKLCKICNIYKPTRTAHCK